MENNKTVAELYNLFMRRSKRLGEELSMRAPSTMIKNELALIKEALCELEVAINDEEIIDRFYKEITSDEK